MVTPSDLWTTWNLDPVILITLALGAVLYARGVWVLWTRAGQGEVIRLWHATAYFTGLLILVAALVSPLDVLSGVLFSAHMAQHMLLVAVAAPLLVLGLPQLALFWALPAGWRGLLARSWNQASLAQSASALVLFPPLIWLLHVGTLLVWHFPALFQTAIGNDALHALEHATLLGTAFLFWWTLLHPMGRGRMSYGGAILFLFGISLATGGLGTIITFSSQPWYPAYASSTAAWNTTLLDDQQVAGSIMWIVGGAIYVAVAGILFALWLREVERAVSRNEARVLEER